MTRFIHYAIERHHLQKTIRDLSLTDELTRLYNRRGFLALAEQHLREQKRNERDFVLILADLDDLKKINDNFGHPEGDFAIRKAAEALTSTFRKSDIIARIGGDEFAVLAMEAEPGSERKMLALLEENIKNRIPRNAGRTGYPSARERPNPAARPRAPSER